MNTNPFADSEDVLPKKGSAAAFARAQAQTSFLEERRNFHPNLPPLVRDRSDILFPPEKDTAESPARRGRQKGTF
jgi:hypothetical protein